MLEHMRKIILIICTGYFGDVILTSKLTRDIKKYFPDSKLVYICDTPYITVAQNLPGVDEVVDYNRKINSNILKYLGFIFKFPYKNQIHHTFIIHQNKKSRIFLAKVLGSKNITAWEHYRYSDFNSKLLEENPKYSNVAYLNANLLSVLTYKQTDDEDVEFLIPDASQQKIDAFLAENNYKNLIAINPQARDADKTWNVEEFVKFVKMLIKDGKTPVITGLSKDGTQHIDALKNDEEINKNDYIDMIDKTNFTELGALYKHCSYVVSVDTGSGHMASAVGVLTLILFFRNDAHLWAPINTKQNAYIYTPDNITAEEVYAKISGKLKDLCYNTDVKTH